MRRVQLAAQRYDLLDILRPQHRAVTILKIKIVTALLKTINTTNFQSSNTRQTLDIVRSIRFFCFCILQSTEENKQLTKIFVPSYLCWPGRNYGELLSSNDLKKEKKEYRMDQCPENCRNNITRSETKLN